MRLRWFHRIFLYGLTVTVLVLSVIVGDAATKANLWGAFTHLLTLVGAFDVGNAIGSTLTKQS
jgi:hypothetical protein